MESIYYSKGYKYTLKGTFFIPIGLYHFSINTPFISLSPQGILTIREGYSWDGPSGPTYDFKSSLKGSLIHDALYQLIQEKLLPLEIRPLVDRLLYDIWISSGLNPALALLGYWAVRLFGKPYATTSTKTLEAP